MGRGKSRKPQGRVSKWAERVALGAVMSVVAFVVERRLLKVLRRRGEEPEKESPASAELSAAPKDVEDQTAG